MGDIWPCRGPWYTTWDDAANAAANAGFSHSGSIVMAAIATAEASLDLSVINDTPSTGDYSVGTWQINYYGSLWASRQRSFGSPCTLIASGVQGQANAAFEIWRYEGFDAWSTYKNGAYEQYLHGGRPGGLGGPGGSVSGDIPPPPGPGGDDYSRTIKLSAAELYNSAANIGNHFRALEALRHRGVG